MRIVERNPLRQSKERVAFVLGAGFASLGGVPIQSEFPGYLLSDEFNSNLDKIITKAIREFLSKVFSWEKGDKIPSFEDIFTYIDLSAGSGHYLGKGYEPRKLRALRRLLIYRIFQILDFKFKYSHEIQKLLKHYLVEQQKYNVLGFIVLNWDIVLEKHIGSVVRQQYINYCCPSLEWNTGLPIQENDSIKICKIHGSSNWVYCENCKSLFFDLNKKISLHQKVGLIKSDFRLFDNSVAKQSFRRMLNSTPSQRSCKICKNTVSSHIASFSYRKSFRTFAYPAIWYEAERVLAEADRWVFIGYSLPEADFEFKHLIKTAQLSRKHKNRVIEIVHKNDANAEIKYKQFFGPRNCKFYSTALEGYVSDLQEE